MASRLVVFVLMDLKRVLHHVLVCQVVQLNLALLDQHKVQEVIIHVVLFHLAREFRHRIKAAVPIVRGFAMVMVWDLLN